MAGGSYNVRQGDTLQGIAQSLWGDSSLWYKLAEANGMSASTGLIEGQTLILPTGVMRSKHNAGTTNPYNPADAIGDLSPTAPQPPKKAKCGVFGQILLAVIAVAITVVAPFGGGFVAGIANSVLGSVVSQAVGVATGIQEKFSFKGVAMAAIGAAVGGALKGFDAFGKVAQGAEGSFKAIANAAVRGAASSAISQGIGVAAGLQQKFSWAGVAAAGVAAGVGQGLGKALDLQPIAGNGLSLSNIAGHGAVGAASLIASAATRSAIDGNSFGDNVIAGLPDVVAQIVGRALGDGLASRKAISAITRNIVGGVADDLGLQGAARGKFFRANYSPIRAGVAAGFAEQPGWQSQFAQAVSGAYGLNTTNLSAVSGSFIPVPLALASAATTVGAPASNQRYIGFGFNAEWLGISARFDIPVSEGVYADYNAGLTEISSIHGSGTFSRWSSWQHFADEAVFTTGILASAAGE